MKKMSKKPLFIISGIFLFLFSIFAFSYDAISEYFSSTPSRSDGSSVSSLSRGLVAHYPLNGEYETKDITPNANHGTNNGATLSTGRKGEANGSYSFDGTDDKITCGTLNIPIGNEDRTLSAWIKQGSGGSGDMKPAVWIGSRLTHKITAIGVRTSTNKLGMTFWSDELDSTTTATVGEWFLLTGTYNGATRLATLYVNGVFAISKVLTSDLATEEYLSIGKEPIGIRAISGNISDVRIYNRALEEDEIKLLYDSFKPEIATSDLNKGLVGHWMLDSENGAKDLTPNGNHGTAEGGVTVGGTTDRKGRSGGATYFDGRNDYVDVGDEDIFDLTEEITLSAWVYSGIQDSSFNGIVSKTVNNSNGWEFRTCNIYNSEYTKIQFRLNGDSAGTACYSLLNYTWYHLIGSYDGNSTKFYVNGKLNDEFFYTSSILINNNALKFGVLGYSSSLKFNGSISDVRIYNRALSPDEIKLLYDSYKPKEASIGSLNKGLVLDMPLTTKHMKSSTVVSDLTPNGNDGNVVNGAIVGGEYTSFDGTNDYVTINKGILPTSVEEYTSVAWIRWDGGLGGGTDGRRFIMESYSSLMHSWIVSFWLSTSNPPRVQTSSPDSGGMTSTVTISQDVWYQIVITYKRNTTGGAKMYINGVLDTSGNTVESNMSFEALRIGTYRDANNRWFSGDISGVKIYNRALSAAEVKLLYEITPKPAITEETINEGLVLDMPLKTPYVSGTTVIDKIGINNGTNSGATIGSDSASFDGVNDYINLPTTPIFGTTNTVTFSSWVNANNVIGSPYIISFGTSNVHWIELTSTSVRFGLKNTDGTMLYYDTTGGITLSVWKLITCTYDGSNMKIYIDGVLSKTGEFTGNITDETIPKNIGKYSGGLSHYFDGSISNAKVWNRALSAEEVAVIYSKGRN